MNVVNVFKNWFSKSEVRYQASLQWRAEVKNAGLKPGDWESLHQHVEAAWSELELDRSQFKESMKHASVFASSIATIVLGIAKLSNDQPSWILVLAMSFAVIAAATALRLAGWADSPARPTTEGLAKELAAGSAKDEWLAVKLHACVAMGRDFQDDAATKSKVVYLLVIGALLAVLAEVIAQVLNAA